MEGERKGGTKGLFLEMYLEALNISNKSNPLS